jgi:hypothetical protein
MNKNLKSLTSYKRGVRVKRRKTDEKKNSKRKEEKKQNKHS